METFQQKFIQDASELLNKLESDILILESGQDNESIDRVFRTLHTLKGASKMFGFECIGKISHNLESAFDIVRQNPIHLDKGLLNLTLHSIDHIRKVMMDSECKNEKIVKHSQDLIKQIEDLVLTFQSTPEILNSVYSEDIISGVCTWFIAIRPSSDFVKRGVHLQSIISELKELGNYKCFLHPLSGGKEGISEAWDVYLATDAEKFKIEDVFMFIQDEVELKLLSKNNLLIDAEFLKSIEIFSNEAEDKNVQKFPDTSLAEIIFKEEKSDKILENERIATLSIKVSASKIDHLMNLVSEFVTTEAELSIAADELRNSKIKVISEKFERLSRQFRDNALSIRLVPIDTIMVQLRRLVRDVSEVCHKEVEFIATGTETEFDKTIIDQLSEPLIHILRNAIDHGIELPDEREKKGKNRIGQITLKAYNAGSHAIIEIIDDGSGINIEKVREKAKLKGLIKTESDFSDKDILNLIFTHGFSTVDKISEVSGRGVGMDVVYQSIHNLRGELNVDTQRNMGTKLLIKLPLTLSIIDTSLVKVNETFLLIPISFIESCHEISHEELIGRSNQNVVIEGELIPYIYLRKELHIIAEPLSKEKLVVVLINNMRFAIVVDSIVGEYQAVLKPIHEIFKKQEIVSGFSILGDGSVALVIDLSKLIRHLMTNRILNQNK